MRELIMKNDELRDLLKQQEYRDYEIDQLLETYDFGVYTPEETVSLIKFVTEGDESCLKAWGFNGYDDMLLKLKEKDLIKFGCYSTLDFNNERLVLFVPTSN